MRLKLPLILVVVGFALAPACVSAAPTLRHWKHPGAERYAGTPEEAVVKLAKFLPKAVQDQMLPMLKTGKGCIVDDIPDGFVFDAMLFGKGQVRLNVVADTKEWPAEASRAALMCTVRVGGIEYILVDPRICGNISVKVIKIQEDCLPCVECEKKQALTS